MRKRVDNTTKLPKDLEAKINENEIENDSRYKYAQGIKRKFPGGGKNDKRKKGFKAPLSRKDSRKEKRDNKKQRKLENYKKTHSIPTDNKIKNANQKENKPKTQNSDLKKNNDQKLKESNINKTKDVKVNKKPIVESEEESDDPEDHIMKDLEKKLGIKSADNLNKRLGDDGLSSLLKGIGVGSFRSKFPSSSKTLPNDDIDISEMTKPGKKITPLAKKILEMKGISTESQSDENMGTYSDSLYDSESNIESLDEYSESDSLSGDEDDEKTFEGFGDENEKGDSNFDGHDISSESESNSEDESLGGLTLHEKQDNNINVENNYSNASLDDSKPKVSAPVKEVLQGTKYIPPSLRAKLGGGDSEKKLRIRKLVMGQLNRLSESNTERTVMEIEKIYSTNPRHDTTEAITDILIASISNKTNLIDIFLYVNAALVGALGRIIGIEASAYFVQELVEKIDNLFKANSLSEVSNVESKDIDQAVNNDDYMDQTRVTVSNKECLNLVAFLSELYNFQVISCKLVYDIMEMAAQSTNETSIEIILSIIKTAGYQLRKDDPAMLKRVSELALSNFGQNGAEKVTARSRFMLEQLQNLRNNRMKKKMLSSADSVIPLKKFLVNLEKKRNSIAPEPINVGLQDIRLSKTQGKWWLVGSYWAGVDNEAENRDGEERKKNSDAFKDKDKDSEYVQLMQLAKAFRMNTDIRRSIFVSIMSSQDAIEAFEKCIRLGLKESQQREIIRVLVLLVGQEESYNHYYTLVARKLCSVNHSFKITLQYTLWDFLRNLGESSIGGLGRIGSSNDGENAGSSDPLYGKDDMQDTNVLIRRISNTAKMYAALVHKRSLDLVIFKTVTFTSLGSSGRLFFQLFFNALFGYYKSNETQKSSTKPSASAIISSRNDTKKSLSFETKHELKELLMSACKIQLLASGLSFFLVHFVRNNDYCEPEMKEHIKSCSKFSKETLLNSIE
ncbi:hypothetical protein BB558_000801 [Smittium angustum]|uniref:MI domain-containing protein n=1 Tax=Smittium angustum TaxID=133377 RepID=A0A2U1JD57_SMIAN|nr:hypothetical protein BB558_000801 [Smittium angustum]